MNIITIWHNPRCSKSREALSILEENGCDKNIVKYLDENIDYIQLKETLTLLGLKPRELMRTKEDIYKELDLINEHDEDRLIDAMVANPILIERPIIFKGNKAIIGRPTSRIIEFLNN